MKPIKLIIILLLALPAIAYFEAAITVHSFNNYFIVGLIEIVMFGSGYVVGVIK